MLCRVSGPEPVEKGGEAAASMMRQNPCGTVGVQTAVLAAVTAASAGNQGHVSKFAGPQNGAAHTVAERQKNQIPSSRSAADLRQSGGVGVVEKAAGPGERPGGPECGSSAAGPPDCLRCRGERRPDLGAFPLRRCLRGNAGQRTQDTPDRHRSKKREEGVLPDIGSVRTGPPEPR